MRSYLLPLAALLTISSFTVCAQKKDRNGNQSLLQLMYDYDEASLKLDPISATARGDNRYNHILFIDFTDSFRLEQEKLYSRQWNSLMTVNRSKLGDQDKINYDLLKLELEMKREALTLKTNLLPFNQSRGLPLYLPLFGSGTGLHPFKTVTDYDNWLLRAAVFPAWSDSAIAYFRRGVAGGFVHPKAVVEKMIPQMADLIKTDPTQSLFFQPINKLPADFSENDKQRLTASYKKLITEQLNPAYQKLYDFLQQEYLPKARLTSGYGSLPGGDKIYNFFIRYYTTTNLSADDVFNTGLSEVRRIKAEMEKVKIELGYTGTLNELFAYMKSDPKFYPYKTEEEILNAYRAIQQRIEPGLKTMFNHTPKTAFEIRQVEAFRAASATPHHMAGSLENNRPGIFYVPIVNVSTTSVEVSFFLHEGIPGHHYQQSLQHENTSLPTLRRYSGNAAYGEGWGLYAESLGKELGVYTDQYQYMRALGWEMHRAIRLVVDAGMHAKGWSREQAIKYMIDNEPITEQAAVPEIERYMSVPGQALSYKIGELKIKELRARYSKQLGTSFNLAAFHDALLMDGNLPLEVLERKMDAWAKQQKK